MNISEFTGDKVCLKWNFKNLTRLEAHLPCIGRTAVQAGGNLGVFPRWMAKRYDRVVTFEPDTDNFRVMCANVHEPNVIKLQAALGCVRMSVGMSKVNNWGRSHAAVTHVSGVGLIPTIRLDDLALENVDLIQLDTEGYELAALRGSLDTIKRCRPMIVMEINKNAKLHGWGMKEVEDLIGDSYTLVESIGPDKIFLAREHVYA